MRRAIVSGTMLAWLALWGCDSLGPGESREPEPDPAAIASGRALFLEHCSICHGERGDGRGARRGSLSRPPTSFQSPVFAPDRARVRAAIRDGIAGSDMPGWQQLGEPALDDLTSYVLAVARMAP